jgi:UDP-3-O-[3-hydroxymyristoyl] glucosamine N-acyltransferase
LRFAYLLASSPRASFAVAYDDPYCEEPAGKGAGAARSIAVEIDAAIEQDAEKDAVAEKNAAIGKDIGVEKDAVVEKGVAVERDVASVKDAVVGTGAAFGRAAEVESGVAVERDVASEIGDVDAAEEPPGSVGAVSSEDRFGVYRQEVAWPTSVLEH